MIGVATGVAFPRRAGRWRRVGRDSGPVLLSEPAALPDAIAVYLDDVSPGVSSALLFGGDAALSDAVEAEVKELLRRA